jgi:hypothetical protein
MDMLIRLLGYFGVAMMFYMGLHLFIEYLVIRYNIRQMEKQDEQD